MIDLSESHKSYGTRSFSVGNGNSYVGEEIHLNSRVDSVRTKEKVT